MLRADINFEKFVISNHAANVTFQFTVDYIKVKERRFKPEVSRPVYQADLPGRTYKTVMALYGAKDDGDEILGDNWFMGRIYDENDTPGTDTPMGFINIRKGGE